jgi:hypothetical protein
MSVWERLRRIQQRKKPSRRPEDDWKDLIAEFAPGRSFIDVGCMWGVHGEYAFHALAHGATSAIGLDRAPATPEFLARNQASNNRIRFVQANIDDPALETLLGYIDVVFCAGVLYHVPNPLLTLGQLRAICAQTLILATPTIPERSEPHVAIFLPHLKDPARTRLTFDTKGLKRGLDVPFEPAREYGNWFWAFTPSCVRAMLATAGFEVRQFQTYRHGVIAVCAPTPSALPSRHLGRHAPAAVPPSPAALRVMTMS